MPDGRNNLVDIVYNQRQRKRGEDSHDRWGHRSLDPAQGIKEYTTNVTAIVTVATMRKLWQAAPRTGGASTGRLSELHSALADAEPLMTKLFQYRFSEGSGLDGHSFGNLFIVAMSGVTGISSRRSGSPAGSSRAWADTSLNHRERDLCAELADEARVAGESEISKSDKAIKRSISIRSFPQPIPKLFARSLTRT